MHGPNQRNANVLIQIKVRVDQGSTLVGMNALNQNTLKPLLASLQVRQTELRREIGEARDAERAEADATSAAETDTTDFKDRAGSLERAALKEAEVQRDRDELADVVAAIARSEQGTYGFCIACDQPIDLSRLTALPAAARCIACQTQVEAQIEARTS